MEKLVNLFDKSKNRPEEGFYYFVDGFYYKRKIEIEANADELASMLNEISISKGKILRAEQLSTIFGGNIVVTRYYMAFLSSLISKSSFLFKANHNNNSTSIVYNGDALENLVEWHVKMKADVTETKDEKPADVEEKEEMGNVDPSMLTGNSNGQADTENTQGSDVEKPTEAEEIVEEKSVDAEETILETEKPAEATEEINVESSDEGTGSATEATEIIEEKPADVAVEETSLETEKPAEIEEATEIVEEKSVDVAESADTEIADKKPAKKSNKK